MEEGQREAAPGSWDSLPVEIAVIILQHAAYTRDKRWNEVEEARATHVICRFVCREWRDILPLPSLMLSA